MAISHPVSGEVGVKVVYCGPEASGKTTNLQFIHQRLDPESRSRLIAPTDGSERTLFLDFLPVQLGEAGGAKTRFHLFTVSGRVSQHETRRLVLRGVDGVVFVADSHPDRMAANRESLADLESSLETMDVRVEDLPMVLQYNKRDIETALDLEILQRELNPAGREAYEAVATEGRGVMESLNAISRQVMSVVYGA
jgi:signal recognition particle receptor subunit beta